MLLAIETSCDDCAAAILDGPMVVVSLRFHQDRLHKKWGGVVPEVASREHLRQIEPTVKAALKKAKIGIKDLSAIAVTQGPGLIGSLLVGLRYAQGLALGHNLPLVGIHHLRGHLFSALMDGPQMETVFPALGLVVSGGHSAIYEVKGFDNIRTLGETMDDAAGEALDKTAKLIGLGFPGGAALSELAKDGNINTYKLPIPLQGRKDLTFSFSGLKTAAARIIEQQGAELNKKDMAAVFQKRVVDHLVVGVKRALELGTYKSLLVGGGVACNQLLRDSLAEVCKEKNVDLLLTQPRYCTDNAAMIGFVAHHLLKLNKNPEFPLEPNLNWRADHS